MEADDVKAVIFDLGEDKASRANSFLIPPSNSFNMSKEVVMAFMTKFYSKTTFLIS